MITIKTYSNPEEANIDKGHLESNGIKCFLKNESFLNARPILNNAVGGIQLQVNEENAEKASKLLEE